MSKERLEEIDQIVEDLYNDKIEIREFVQYSLEQVQEWEGIAKWQNDEKIKIEKVCLELEEQNKRYRDALTDIKRILDTYPHVDYSKSVTRRNLFYLAHEALEGDPHESS